LHARLRAAPRGATGQQGAAYAHITRALVATITSLVEQIKILSEQIGAQLAAHADAQFNCAPHCFKLEIPPGEEFLRT
jgi:transposase